MSPSEINHAVAQVLGEAIDVVRQRGFDLADSPCIDLDFDQRAPLTIDWDASDEDHLVSIYEVAY